MKPKIYEGFCYVIYKNGVKIWKEGDAKPEKMIDNWYFKPQSEIRKKKEHPSVLKWSSATDKQVQKWIRGMNQVTKQLKRHEDNVSGHKVFKYQVGEYLLMTIDPARMGPGRKRSVLYRIESTSKSDSGNAYDLKGVRVIECDDPADHRVRGIYSPYAHVVEDLGEFTKVEGEKLAELMTKGFAV